MSLHAARASFSSRQTHHLIWWSTVRKRRPDPAEESSPAVVRWAFIGVVSSVHFVCVNIIRKMRRKMKKGTGARWRVYGSVCWRTGCGRGARRSVRGCCGAGQGC
ncbi:hypothetical protein V6Z11_A12G044000 [Gossypium hirsutum]